MKRIVFFVISAVAFLLPSLLATVHKISGPEEKIQAVIDVALDGDTVLVPPGNYQENINFIGKQLVVASEFLLDHDPETIRQTILDGSLPDNPDSGSVIVIASGEPYGTALIGFTITGGIGTSVPGSFVGGGILVTAGCSPTIEHNIIYNNSALRGAGLAIRNANATIAHNVIYQNSASTAAGLLIENSNVTMNHNTIIHNVATVAGGAVYSDQSNVVFSCNVVAFNSGGDSGGLNCNAGNWDITFSDFFENSGADFVGCDDELLGDTANDLNYNLQPADVYQNIFVAPLLSDPAGLDFTLRCDSPLIDAAAEIPDTYPNGGSRCDIGAFEYPFRIGDFNGDARINLVDAIVFINIIFDINPLPCPIYIADLDCSRRINIADLVTLIAYWAGFGPPPCGIPIVTK